MVDSCTSSSKSQKLCSFCCELTIALSLGRINWKKSTWVSDFHQGPKFPTPLLPELVYKLLHHTFWFLKFCLMWIKHEINFIQWARHTWMEMYNNLFFSSQRGRISTSHGKSVLPTIINWFLATSRKNRRHSTNLVLNMFCKNLHFSESWKHCVKCTALLHSVKSGDKNEERSIHRSSKMRRATTDDERFHFLTLKDWT